jgi:glutamate synthase (NADPH/NADH) large chain
VPADVPRLQVANRTTAWTRRWTCKLIEKCRPAIERGEKVQFMEEARNVNRSVGAMLSGELIRHRPEGLPDHTIFMQMEGTGGQSFGAFLARASRCT